MAAIAGGVHNYQRYPVLSPDERVIHYIVCGGGGAKLAPTHYIRKSTIVPEDFFTCYPLRSDSLAVASRAYHPRTNGISLDPRAAAAYVSLRLGILPSRGAIEPAALSIRDRLLARSLFSRLLRPYVTSLMEERPPFFKSFLRIDIKPGELRIRCYGATGYRIHEANPPINNEIRIPLG